MENSFLNLTNTFLKICENISFNLLTIPKSILLSKETLETNRFPRVKEAFIVQLLILLLENFGSVSEQLLLRIKLVF